MPNISRTLKFKPELNQFKDLRNILSINTDITKDTLKQIYHIDKCNKQKYLKYLSMICLFTVGLYSMQKIFLVLCQ